MHTVMEEPQKIVDVLNLQLPRNNVFRSLRSNQHQYKSQMQISPDIIQQKWQETIDPVKLVLGKVIGRGAFGVVHKGSYLGQTVAVKVLDFGDKGCTKALMESVKNDFVKETCLWQNLNHPNITKMIGATMSMRTNSGHKNRKLETESNFCIVSEYVEGGSLRSYLLKKKNKKLHMNVVLRFALDIAKGLSYLHSKKIIHRDVKPDNMLIGKQHTIKLADFGESVFESLELLLSCGETTGTRGYMAPEVVCRKPYGHKCDVYSFGICLWEIYSCEVAYTYELDNIPPDIYTEMRPSIPINCPRSLARLMERCWDTNPMKRPEMETVVRELELMWNSETKDHVYSCLNLFTHGSRGNSRSLKD